MNRYRPDDGKEPSVLDYEMTVDVENEETEIKVYRHRKGAWLALGKCRHKLIEGKGGSQLEAVADWKAQARHRLAPGLSGAGFHPLD